MERKYENRIENLQSNFKSGRNNTLFGENKDMKAELEEFENKLT